MGRFYLRGNGDIGPSDSYLETHRLTDYDPDSDWYNDEYNVEEDDEILYMQRTCDKCGCTFTLYEAMSDFADRIDGIKYSQEYSGEYCGNCAADMLEAKSI